MCKKNNIYYIYCNKLNILTSVYYLGLGLNQRPLDFQSTALPLSYLRFFFKKIKINLFNHITMTK